MRKAGIILHVTAMHARKLGAFERHLIELARRCHLEGYQTVLQYEATPESRAFTDALREAEIDTTVSATLAGPILSVIRIGALIRRLRPRIVHTHFLNGYAHLAVPVIAHRSGARRCVATIHYELTGRKTDWHLRWAYSRYDRVLCVSEAIRREVIMLGVPSSIVSTHYLGIFADREKTLQQRLAARAELGLPEGAPVLACIAREDPAKGLDVLVDALAILVRRHPYLETIVFGVEAGAPQLSALASARGLEGRIHWLGVRSDASRLLAAADLYVQPSRLEGLGLAILEAMAAGLPIVASRVGGIPEAVVDGVTGFLVTPESAPLVAGAVNRLLTNPGLARALGAAGRRRYEERFQGSVSIERMMEVYFGAARRDDLPPEPALGAS